MLCARLRACDRLICNRLCLPTCMSQAPGFSTADVSGGIADVLVVKGKVQLSAARVSALTNARAHTCTNQTNTWF